MPTNHVPILRRLLGLRLMTAVLFLLIIFLSVSFGREVVRGMEINRNIVALQSQVDALSARNLEITHLATAFQTQSFIEREARLKLGMKKPGEEVVVIQGGDDGTSVSSGSARNAADQPPATPSELIARASEPEPVANPTKWWYYFFDQTRFTLLTR